MKIKRLVSVILTFLIICSFSFPVSALTLGELLDGNPWGDEYISSNSYISWDELSGPYYDFDYADIYKNGEFHYFYRSHYDEDTKETKYSMYIYHYCGDDTIINIPSNINGWPVVGIYSLYSIGRSTKNVEEVNIPASVTGIYENAISELKNLKKVHFEKNSQLTHIEKLAFSRNVNLEEINLPESLQSIGNGAFSACYSLKEITIPKKCVSLEKGVFVNCDKLETITFKSDQVNYRYIEENGTTGYMGYTDKENAIPPEFAQGCTSLKSITIPKNVKTIYKNAFKGCKNLTSVKFAGKVNNIGRSAFSKCVNLKTVNFTKGYLKKVYDYAFYKCEKLDKITISNTKNVPSIHKSAFNKAKSGIKFYVKNNTVAKKLKSKLQKTNIKKAKIYRSAPILIYKNVG